MGTTGVEWGWRVPCHAPGCGQYLIQWGGKLGPPTLCSTDKSWFLSSDQNSKNGYRDYRAYCGEHSAQVREWADLHQKWRADRRAYGRECSKKVKPTFWDGIMSVFLPGWHKVVGGSVQEWEKENPEPPAPWEEGGRAPYPIPGKV